MPPGVLSDKLRAIQHGKGSQKRYLHLLKRHHNRDVSQAAIRRLARRGGCRRISGLIYDETRAVLRHFLERILGNSIIYMEHARRRTLTAKDVVYALKKEGKTIYGF